jgi:hypothetical protein
LKRYSSTVAYVIVGNVTPVGGTVDYLKCNKEMTETDNIAYIGIAQSVGIALQLRGKLGLESMKIPWC